MTQQSGPPLDLLTGRSFPDLAAALRARSAAALARWEQAVRRALPAADELTFGQLRDNTPPTLAKMADALAATHAGPTEAFMAASGEHGAARFHQDYQVGELLIEYNLLRRVVFEEIAGHLGRPLAGDEVAVLNLTFDVALREGVVAFTEHQSRQLRSATERHSKYLSFLSHDLRGGLNGIFLMTDVIRREIEGRPEFGELAGDLEMMRRSIKETVATMDRFLHAERFRKGKVQLNAAPMSLKSLLGEVAAQFAYQAREKEIELKTEVPDESGAVCDRELLLMVLQNLVSNAVKYTARGAVRLGAEPPTAGRGWRVEVSDEGPGIEPGKLGELFATFARGETYGQPGVGLGLSIAHQAAQLMGARLWAESDPGRGSRFYVDLPLQGARTTPPGGGEASAKAPEGTGASRETVAPEGKEGPPVPRV